MRFLPTTDELRHAARALARSPGFVVTAVVTLGLSIALSVTMVGVVDTLRNPRRPIPRPTELVRLTYATIPPVRIDPKVALGDGMRQSGMFVDTTSTASYGYGFPATPGGLPQLRFTQIRSVDPAYFGVIGLRPYGGRLLVESDRVATGPTPAVLSYRLWRRFVGAEVTAFTPFDLRIDTLAFTAVGVLAEYAEIDQGDVLVLPRRIERQRRAAVTATVIGRLKPGMTIARAQEALDRFNRGLAERAGVQLAESRFRMAPLFRPDERVQGITLALAGAVLCILLVACANIANLHLARGLTRLRELAVRTALGASRGDVIRLLLAESAIVAVMSVAASVLLTWQAMYVVRHLLPPDVKALGIVDVQVSWRLVTAGLGITVFCGAIFGLLPALRVSRLDINSVLKTRLGVGDGRRMRHHYRALIACEVASALALTIVAALLVRSALRVRLVDFGFDTSHVAQASLMAGRRGDDSVVWGGALPLVDAVRREAGVRAVGLMTGIGIDGDTLSSDDADLQRAQRLSPNVSVYAVTGDLPRALGVPIIKGRDFPAGLDAGGGPVAIVDSLVAARLWPGTTAVGRRLKLGPAASTEHGWIPVIGVSRHVRSSIGRDLSEGDEPLILVLGNQAGPFRGALVARGSGDATLLATRIRAIADGQPLLRIEMAGPFDVLSGRLTMLRAQTFIGSLFMAFAALGLGLAMVGVYGVVNHAVVQRRREFGLRVALGARSVHVLRHVIDDGNAPVFIGIALGLLAAEQGYELIGRFLVDHSAVEDTLIFAAGAVGLGLVALVTMLGPAMRATRANPVEALRPD